MKYNKEKYVIIKNMHLWQQEMERYIRECYQDYDKDNGFKSLERAIDEAATFGMETIVTVCYASDAPHSKEQAVSGGASEDDAKRYREM